MGYKFETEGDLEHEEKAREVFERWAGCEVVKLPISYKIDWIGTKDGQVQFWAEFKRRTHPVDRFPTVILSMRKMSDLVGLARLWSCPAYVVVQFYGGGIYVHKVDTEAAYEISHFARNNKRHSGDDEPVVGIPVKKFKIIS